MDKNTIIGFVLIGLIMFGFSFLNQPSKEEIAQKRRADSIAYVQQQESHKLQQAALNAADTAKRTLATDTTAIKDLSSTYGDFAHATVGEDKMFVLQNELLVLKISAKGGYIASAMLPGYKDFQDKQLYLFDEGENKYSFAFNTRFNQIIRTDELYFSKVAESSNDTTLTLRLAAGENASMDFIYTLRPATNRVDFKIQSRSLEKILAPNSGLQFNWEEKLRQQEKGRSFEDRHSYLVYKYPTENVEQLSESSNDEKALQGKVKWIGYKDQFFSSVAIADQNFSHVTVKSEYIKNTASPYLMFYSSQADVEIDPTGAEPTSLSFYLGPNHYPTLKAFDKGVDKPEDQLKLDQLVPLGWALFRWISQWLVIPLFSFFGGFIDNFGIVILLLTIVIKIIIFPMTYKSYVSMAKMRVIRPQVNEINEKYKGQEKALDRQKATMALYSKLGISPMSGCLPMLLQFPILLAMFSFFPSSIELRGESFLWASDLSTYDAIVTWDTYIPIISPYFGNHISLFCLLMTITNLVYTKFNMDAQGQTEGIPGMKAMQYMMPVMFLVFFNQYPSGLSYYYFVSTLITVLQTLAFRYFINEEKLLAKIHEKAKKNEGKKKSGFMARLEQMQKNQEKVMRERNKKK